MIINLNNIEIDLTKVLYFMYDNKNLIININYKDKKPINIKYNTIKQFERAIEEIDNNF